MKPKTARPLATQALRCGLICAAAGLAIATALYLLNPWMGFPEWALFFWPSALAMMGLSGVSESAATAGAVAIIASNGVWYFVLGVTLTPPAILARRALGQVGRAGK